jgi:cell wall-associated NlpC family hydrolase
MIAVCGGILFVWSGVKGWSILGTVEDVIKGRKPEEVNTLPLTIPGGGRGISATGPIYLPPGQGSIAQVALQYQGHAYRFGGAPGKDGTQPWDCSSFVNYVIAVRQALTIPGYKTGAYDGTSHGPTTGQWAVWPGLVTIKREDVAVNDIVVWTGHMGIAISNAQYISAQNPTNGTRISSIDGERNGSALRYGRYRGVV